MSWGTLCPLNKVIQHSPVYIAFKPTAGRGHFELLNFPQNYKTKIARLENGNQAALWKTKQEWPQ